MKLFPLASLTLLLSCYAFRPKEKICGHKLVQRIREICTPYGEEQPCFHKPDWNKQTAYDKIVEITNRIKRESRINYNTRTHFFEKALKLCCEQECNPNDLQKLCCTESEARIYYKFMKNMNRFKANF